MLSFPMYPCGHCVHVTKSPTSRTSVAPLFVVGGVREPGKRLRTRWVACGTPPPAAAAHAAARAAMAARGRERSRAAVAFAAACIDARSARALWRRGRAPPPLRGDGCGAVDGAITAPSVPTIVANPPHRGLPK